MFFGHRSVRASSATFEKVGRVVPNAPLARDSRKPRGNASYSRSAFTLLEILLALAIIGLLAAVLIGASDRVLDNKPTSVDEMFWAAVQEARKSALRHEREVYLRFVDDRETGRAFVVTDGPETKPFPIPSKADTRDLSVDFLRAQKGGNAILIAGVLVETQPIKVVTFFPDGTCTGFRVQVYRNGAAHQLAIDPWTCAPVLTPPDPYAPK
jgi:prepilin-type N-terminal cleavage/methylation domain-containing protein